MRLARRKVCWKCTRHSINRRENHSRANDVAKTLRANTISIVICCTRIAIHRDQSWRNRVTCAENCLRGRTICVNICEVTSVNRPGNETISVRIATNHFTDRHCSSEYPSNCMASLDTNLSISFQHSYSHSHWRTSISMRSLRQIISIEWGTA